MPKALLPCLVLFLCACIPAENEAQYELPDSTDACNKVDLADGKVDGAPEFELLFACINNMGAVEELAPMVDDLGNTINPATGMVYLEDLVEVTNAVLADENLGDVVQVAATVVDQGMVDDVLPVGATVIDSGLMKELLPVVQSSIDSGAAATALAPASTLFRDPRMPQLIQGVKGVIDDGLAEGWMGQMLPDLATMLTVQDASGDPALRAIMPPLTEYLASGDTGGLVPVMDQLLDTGTVDDLIAVTRTLSDQGVLLQMDTQLRPLMLHDAAGHSDLQGTLEILAGTDQPLTCLGLEITPNLAKMILETMADRTPQDVQNLVSILRATLGLAGLVCALPPAVEQHIDSLDALAQSGALDGMLPMLKVFKAQGQVQVLVDVLVAVHDSGALPALEPVLVSAVDAGVMDRLMATVPHLIQADGTAAPSLVSLLEMADLMVTPTTFGDPSSAPAASLLPLFGAAGAGGETALADALFLLGQTIQDPASGFDAILPALAAALGADPDGQILIVVADLIDTGSVERALPMMSRVIEEGHAEAMLPWASGMIHDGTADALLQVLARAFDLMVVAQ